MRSPLPDNPSRNDTVILSTGLGYRHLSETRIAVCLIPGPVFVLWFKALLCINFHNNPVGAGGLRVVPEKTQRRQRSFYRRGALRPLGKRTVSAATACGGSAVSKHATCRVLEDQIRAAQTDAIHIPGQQPLQRFVLLMQREPDARRAAVYR